MFDSLADKMKEDDKKEHSTTERMVVWVVVAVASVVLFGGLYMGVRLLE
jgi:hypothetical protein